MYRRDREDDLINNLKFESVREFLIKFTIENQPIVPYTSKYDYYDIQYALTRCLDDYNNEIYDSMSYDELKELDYIDLDFNDFGITKELLIFNINKDFEYRYGFVFKKDLERLVLNDDLNISNKAFEVLQSFNK